MNLVIGDSSQQAKFYPDSYVKVPSRNFDFSVLNDDIDSIYITFAEQRIYDTSIDYRTTNYDLPLRIIEKSIESAEKIVVFGTCELWGKATGTIYKDTDFNFEETGYTKSKADLIKKITEKRKESEEWSKVKIINPFYFNSSWRSTYFLFGKIFQSIINEEQIEVGNLDFYRDMVHTKFLVDKVIETEDDLLVGSGRLFNVKDFIFDLYDSFGLSADKYLVVNKTYKTNEKFIRPKVDWTYTYNDLLSDTIEDIKARKV